MAVPPYQLKQKPTDAWSIREKLALASSVERTRDQNWVSVSRQIKPFAETNRPPDWFSQKNCALQYGALLEDVEHPKRKRGEEIATPGSIIVKNLVQERIKELEKLLSDGLEKHERLQRELALLTDDQTDDQKVESMVDEANTAVESEIRQEEVYERWLKERELEAERQRQRRLHALAMKTKKQVRTISDASDSMHSDDSNLVVAPESPLPPPPSSSLLTTLLRSPTQSPNQSPRTCHGSLQSNTVPSVSLQRLSAEPQNTGSNAAVPKPTACSSIQAPTLSKLLEQAPPSAPSTPAASVDATLDDKNQVKLVETVKDEIKVKQEPTFQDTLSAIEDVTSRLQEPPHIAPLDPSIARAVEAVPEVDVGDENIISVIEQLQEDMQRKEEEDNQRKQLMAMQQSREVPPNAVSDPLQAQHPQSETQQAHSIEEMAPLKTPPEPQSVKIASLRDPSRELSRQTQPQKQQSQQEHASGDTQSLERSTQGASSSQAPQQTQHFSPQQIPQTSQTPGQQSESEQQPQQEQQISLQRKEPPMSHSQSQVKQSQQERQHPTHQPQQTQQEEERQAPSESSKFPSSHLDANQDEKQESKSQSAEQKQAVPFPKPTNTKVSAGSQIPAEELPKKVQRDRDSTQKLRNEQKSSIETLKTASAERTSKAPNPTTDAIPQNSVRAQVPKSPQVPRVTEADEEVKTEKREDIKIEPAERSGTTESYPAHGTEEVSGQDSCHEPPVYEEHVASNAELESETLSQRGVKDGHPEQDEMIEEEVSEEEITHDQDHELGVKNTAALESQAAVPAAKNLKESSTDKEKDVDRERDQKIWKKSALLVWRTAANHSNASVFLNPVPEDMAPGYDDIVFKPMDLATIRKNIENGVIKTSMELLRDMMLMFQNAIMYNSADHDVFHMAIEMQDDVVKQIEELMANEASERTGASHPPEGLKRPARHRHSDSDVTSKKPRRSTGFGFK
ncbi:bromodomain-containing protein 8 [Galendromus occidentalis]|uniref:Bromodomain-containing protein 8 n=1 Tax=Galendromus occidentalis TaxID=34638 RepID=A0AAJ6QMA9_9ACAR|nr:bromodomain-containing protein 8 [Galendromus occidentalis]